MNSSRKQVPVCARGAPLAAGQTPRRHGARFRFTARRLVSAVILFLMLGAAPAAEVAVVEYELIGVQAASQRVLAYYLPGDAVEAPRLAVALMTDPVTGVARAEVFDAPEGTTFVPLRVEGDRAVILAEARKALELTAPNGWTTPDGRPRYEYDVRVFGGVRAMWGSEAWLTEVSAEEESVFIKVRDGEPNGNPAWDLRQLLPPFGTRGYIRVNYAEAKCDTPVEVLPSVSPQWPLVTAGGGYEQLPGTLRPPIVVDWERARVTHFSEVVTVRNQNCSYSFYSIAPLAGDAATAANFETPFAFYDLSGQGTGYPNLVLRTEYYPAGDRFSTVIAPIVQRGRPVPEPIQWIRYAWRSGLGDGHWDFQVEVLGNYRFADVTSIAGGEVDILAPAYETYPEWVLDRSWPIVTFIDTEGASYESSEGLYEWSPRGVGHEYFLAGGARPDLSGMGELPVGFRGEVRASNAAPVELYVSAIDGRVHLLGMEYGVWRLDNGRSVVLEDLSGDGRVDAWSLVSAEAERQVAPATAAGEPSTVAELVVGDSHAVTADGDGVRIWRATVPADEPPFQPPRDASSWAAHRSEVASLGQRRADPIAMVTWPSRFARSDAPMLLEGARLLDSAIVDGSLISRVEMPAEAPFPDGIEVASAAAPSEQAQRWIISAGPSGVTAYLDAAPQLLMSFRIPAEAPAALIPTQMVGQIVNAAAVMAWGDAEMRIDEEVVWREEAWTLAPGESFGVPIQWVPPDDGAYAIELLVGGVTVAASSIQVAASSRAGSQEALRLSLADAGPSWPLVVAIAFACALAFAWIAAQSWRRF